MIALKGRTLDRFPWLGAELFDLLKRNKERSLSELHTNGPTTPEDAARRRLPAAGIDPLPCGVEPLRRLLDVMIDYAGAHALSPRREAVDELFDPRTLALA